MLLQNKNAVIYGAGGSLGGAVARVFAREGATVFLTGRSLESLQKVEADIVKSGGKAEAAIVDAMDEDAVKAHLEGLVARNRRIDISFNAIGLESVQGIPFNDMQLNDFTRPVFIAMQTLFITATAAGRHMVRQRSGAILFLTATPAGKAYPQVGGFGPACSAIEGFCRNLASELGPSGVRVVGIRSAGSPDSAVFIKAIEEGGTPAQTEVQALADDTMLRRLPLMNDIAETAAFIVSDRAAALTGSTVNLTCGTTMD
jgi:NAD(P)-dependent dehydrogenase (short-subunit alcohol dehydrogenase family)